MTPARENPLAVLEGPFLGDVLDQPAALERTLDRLEAPEALTALASRLRDGRAGTVVLTGMGASFHALPPLQLALIDHGLVPVAVETSELIHHQTRLLRADTLVVAVSQSGRTVETVRLLEVNAGRAPVVGVTNTPESPLADRADAAIVTQAGDEFSVSCKTYVSALMALEWLGAVFCERDLPETRDRLRPAIAATASYLAEWESHVRSLIPFFDGVRLLYLVGRGSSLAAVGTGALVLKETARFTAEGMSAAGLRHGPLETLGDDTCVVVFEGDGRTRELNRRLAEDVRRKGGRAMLVGEEAPAGPGRLPAVPPGVRPIVEMLAVQMIAFALAARAGREPGRLTLAAKVTTTE